MMTIALKELKKSHEDTVNLVKESSEKAFRTYFDKLFMVNPKIQAVRWTQYTPYFNDGDECHFRVGGVEAKIAGHDVDGRYSSDGFEYEPAEVNEVVKDFESIEQVLFLSFGDHKQITVTPESIKVENYDHE